MGRAGQTLTMEQKGTLRSLVRSEFDLRVDSVLLRHGQHYVDLRITVRLPEEDQERSWFYYQVPADQLGHLDWPRWLEGFDDQDDPEYPEAWLIKHWLEVGGMLPEQLARPL